jgi:hypothetical protein
MAPSAAARVVLRLGVPRDSHREVRILMGDLQVGSVPSGGGGVASVDIDARSSRSSGAAELRFVNPGGTVDTPALTLLWVRVEPLPIR